MMNSLPDNYLLPTLRDGVILHQFHGAVKTRILQQQGWIGSKLFKPFFTAESIEAIWPEANMRFFGIRYGGDLHSWQLSDVKLHELNAIDQWMTRRLPELLPANECFHK